MGLSTFPGDSACCRRYPLDAGSKSGRQDPGGILKDGKVGAMRAWGGGDGTSDDKFGGSEAEGFGWSGSAALVARV